MSDAVDACPLLLFALDERDALPVLAQAREHVAQLGLGLVLVLGDGNEAAADHHHRSARDHGVDHRRDHQKARDMNVHAADGEVERAADGPQHHDEGRGRQEGRGHAGNEIDRRLGRDPHVVGDAVFRILVVAAHQVELVVATAGQPAVDQVVDEPFAPASLEGHPGVNLRDVHGHARQQDREIDHREKKTASESFFSSASKMARFQRFIP